MDQMLQKGTQLYGAEGWGLFATDDGAYAVMEWENECAARLAWLIHETLRRHALNTNGVQRYGSRGLLVRDLKMVEVTVVVRATEHDTELTLKGRSGAAIDRDKAARVPGAKPSRVATMEDVALHTARTLRAHLAPLGVNELSMQLHFGIGSNGECLLQVPNPLECSFGDVDDEAICSQLGDKH